MEFSHPLQLSQLQLSWKFFHKVYKCVYGNFLTVLSRGHLWRQALMLDETIWLTVAALIHPKGVLSGIYGPCFVHQPSPNYSHNTGSMKMSIMSYYAETLNIILPGTEGSRPSPHHNPPSKLYTRPNAVRQVLVSYIFFQHEEKYLLQNYSHSR